MGSRGTILVVDDNLDTNEVLVCLLAVPCGVYRAVAAFDGREALAEQHRQWQAVTQALNGVWPGSGALLTSLGEA